MNGKSLKSLVAAAVGAVMFVGCIKDTPIEPPRPVSYVSVVNMSLKAPAVEMLFGDQKVTTPINPGAYFSRYSTVDPGAKNVSFKKASSDSLVASLPAGDYYDSSKFYTVLLYDNPGGGSKAVRIQDIFSGNDANRAYYRFYQLSVDMPSVDLYFGNNKVEGNRTPADNVNSPSYNQFKAIDPGSFSLKATAAGTDSVIASTTFSDFAAMGYYTIFLKGVKGGTGAGSFTIEVLRALN